MEASSEYSSSQGPPAPTSGSSPKSSSPSSSPSKSPSRPSPSTSRSPASPPRSVASQKNDDNYQSPPSGKSSSGNGHNHHSPPPRKNGSNHHKGSPHPKSSSNKDDVDGKFVIIGAAAGAGLLLFVVVIFFVVKCGRPKKKKQNPQFQPQVPPPSGYGGGNGWSSSSPMPPPSGGIWSSSSPMPPGPIFSGSGRQIYSGSGPIYSGEATSNNFSSPYHQQMPPPPPNFSIGFNKNSFTYEELSVATNGFSQANMIGQGGFGYVFKGVLPNEKEVAIKCMKAGSGQGDREFQAEVEIVSRVHHRHLVSLVGFCVAGDQRMLVYDFVPNKTLEHHLHGKGVPVMDFTCRLRIALEKSDVFSFGIMLLELITGKPPVDLTNKMEDTLVDWARPLLDRALATGNHDELIDPRLEGNYDHGEMQRMVACASASIRHSAKRRPKMSQIVRALQGDAALDDLNVWVKPTDSNISSLGLPSQEISNSEYNSFGDMQNQRRS
ncbi:hypothetical protein CXB51_008848 [Gossypium anomalum]|uniref:non-specific serine/threonine protein kinase n=1 Tax=Gossypium anomalum TaxID=47600 RepID=A0A8J6DAU2_9ROSI|nr:hypothetical protein CXB51_008848 [Gossypium anomalum]